MTGGRVELEASADTAIECVALTKRFGSRIVLDAVTFEARPREVVGLVGPNGAGKSTLLRILSGLVRPSRGTVRLFGRDGAAARRATTIGYCPEQPAFYPWLTGRQNARVLSVGRAPELGERDWPGDVPAGLRLGTDLDRRVADYSHGMRQRLGLALAVAARPGVLLLDEPGNGLDPIGLRELRETIRQASRGGATVLIASHVLADVERLCDRIVVLVRGRVRAVGATGELAAGMAKTRVVVRREDRERALQALVGRTTAVTDDAIMVAGTSGEVNRCLAYADVFAEEIGPAGIRLEDAFRDMTRDRD